MHPSMAIGFDSPSPADLARELQSAIAASKANFESIGRGAQSRLVRAAEEIQRLAAKGRSGAIQQKPPPPPPKGPILAPKPQGLDVTG